MEHISCITPTYNRCALLEKAIISCIIQTYPHWEMIIVDDGSTDGTESLVADYISQDQRIKYFRNPGKGASSARNYGILMSQGDYIVFLDDDDEHLPHRFESQLSAVKRSGYEFILSWFSVKDLLTGEVSFPEMHINTGYGAGHGVRWMIKKDLVVKAGLFDESMPAMQEVELSYRIAKYTNYAFHDSVVIQGGVNHSSITKTSEKMILGRTILLDKHANSMHPAEAGWWYFVLGLDYFCENDYKMAGNCIRTAAERSKRVPYRLGYLIYCIMWPFGGIIRKVIFKILQKIADYRFPLLVNHPVIGDETGKPK